MFLNSLDEKTKNDILDLLKNQKLDLTSLNPYFIK